MSRSNCCFLTFTQISQEAGEVVWSSHLLNNFPQFVVIHTVKGFGLINKAEIDIFLELSCFFDDPTYVGNLIFGSSAFSNWIQLEHLEVHSSCTLHVCLACRISIITLLAVRWVQLCGSLSILWHCLSSGLEWKLIFSSPVATVEFSRFAGIMYATLSQHHLLGFEIAQLEFHHLHKGFTSCLWIYILKQWLFS